MALNYQRNSDYKLKKIILQNFSDNEIDVQNDFVSLEYHESIYENFISGKLVIQDSFDLSQFFPLIGEEKITFAFSTDEAQAEGNIEKVFYVYRAETNQDEEVLAHTLYFVSKEAFDNQNTLISKSYKRVTAKTILEDVFTFLNSDKNLTADNTKGLHHVVVPNWSPLQTINWLCSFAQHPSYISGSFLFFENKDGFNFKTLETLLDQEIKESYSHALQNLNIAQKKNKTNDGFTAKSVRQLSGSADTLKSLQEGMYANRYIAYDNISKSFELYNYNYSGDFNSTVHLNEFKLNSDLFEYDSNQQRFAIIPSTLNRETSSYFQTNFGDPLSFRQEETAPYKTSVYSQISSRQFEIEFYGDSKMTCGDVVSIEMQNVTQLDSKRGQPHRYNRRKFLLTSCKHKFNRKEYFITSRAVSDSLINKPEYLF